MNAAIALLTYVFSRTYIYDIVICVRIRLLYLERVYLRVRPKQLVTAAMCLGKRENERVFR